MRSTTILSTLTLSFGIALLPVGAEANKDRSATTPTVRAQTTVQTAPQSSALKSGAKAPSPAAFKSAPATTATKTPKKLVDGWELQQNSSYRGAITLQICPTGAKLKSRDLTCLMEPGSKVGYLLHEQNKRYVVMDPSKGIAGLGTMSYFPGPETVTKIGEEQLFGLKTTHYLIIKFKMDDKACKSNPHWLTDLWVCNDLGISKDFAGNCAKICMLPSQYGLPVRVVRVYATGFRRQKQSQEEKNRLQKKYGSSMTHEKYCGGDARILLDLIKKPVKVKLDPQLAKLPAGFKKVNNEVDLIMTDEKKKLLKEIEDD